MVWDSGLNPSSVLVSVPVLSGRRALGTSAILLLDERDRVARLPDTVLRVIARRTCLQYLLECFPLLDISSSTPQDQFLTQVYQQEKKQWCSYPLLPFRTATQSPGLTPISQL